MLRFVVRVSDRVSGRHRQFNLKSTYSSYPINLVCDTRLSTTFHNLTTTE